MSAWRPAIAILAGGQSRRMGRDKALLPFRGEPLLARTLRLALGTGCPVLVVGRAAAPGVDAAGAAFVEDEVPGRGPLGGLLTALHAGGGDVVLLACDMPDLEPAALAWLLAAAEGRGRDGLVTRTRARPLAAGGRLQPLFSVYCAACGPLAAEQVRRGRLAMREFIARGAFAFADLPEHLSGCLRNVNTPADLE